MSKFVLASLIFNSMIILSTCVSADFELKKIPYCPAKKGGWRQRGTYRFASDVYTLKGLLSCFKFEKNRLLPLGSKKSGVFFMWGTLPKTQRRTDKKANEIFLKYKEIQMLKYFTRYKEAVSHIWLCNRSLLNFLTRKIWFSCFHVHC